MDRRTKVIDSTLRIYIYKSVREEHIIDRLVGYCGVGIIVKPCEAGNYGVFEDVGWIKIIKEDRYTGVCKVIYSESKFWNGPLRGSWNRGHEVWKDDDGEDISSVTRHFP